MSPRLIFIAACVVAAAAQREQQHIPAGAPGIAHGSCPNVPRSLQVAPGREIRCFPQFWVAARRTAPWWEHTGGGHAAAQYLDGGGRWRQI